MRVLCIIYTCIRVILYRMCRPGRFRVFFVRYGIASILLIVSGSFKIDTLTLCIPMDSSFWFDTINLG